MFVLVFCPWSITNVTLIFSFWTLTTNLRVCSRTHVAQTRGLWRAPGAAVHRRRAARACTWAACKLRCDYAL